MGVHSFICYFIQAKKNYFYLLRNQWRNQLIFSIIKISKTIFSILYEKYTFFFSHITYFLKYISSFSFLSNFSYLFYLFLLSIFIYFWWKYNYEGVCVYCKNTFARNLPILLFIYYYHFNQKINLVGILRQDSFFKIILSSTSLPTFLIISIHKNKINLEVSPRVKMA